MFHVGIIKLTVLYILCITCCYHLEFVIKDWMWQSGILLSVVLLLVIKKGFYTVAAFLFAFILFQFQDIQSKSPTYNSAVCKINRVIKSQANNRLFCSCKSKGEYFKSIIYSKSIIDFRPSEVYYFQSHFKQHRNHNLPHEFSYSNYLKLEGFYYESKLSRYAYQKRIKQENWLSYLQKKLMAAIHRRLNKTFNHSTASLVKALCFGDKSTLDDQTYQSFRKAGLMHIIAVSGLHVGILQFILLGFFRFILGRGARAVIIQQAIVVVLLFGFAWLCQFSISIVRAILMFTILYYGVLSKRVVHSIHGLFLSAFFLLLYNPMQLFSVGFQFSYLATFGLLIFGPYIQLGLSHIRLSFVRWVIQLTLISLVAQLVLSPLMFYYFGEIPIWFLVFNIPGFVFVTFVIYLTLVFFLTSLISEFLGDGVAFVLEWIVNKFQLVLSMVDHIEYLYLTYKLHSIPEAILFSFLLFLCVRIVISSQWRWCKYALIGIVSFSCFRGLMFYKQSRKFELIIWNTHLEQAITYKRFNRVEFYSSYQLPVSKRVLEYIKANKSNLDKRHCKTSNFGEVSNLYSIKSIEGDTVICVTSTKGKPIETYFQHNHPDKTVIYWFFKDVYNTKVLNPDKRLKYGPTVIPKNYSVYFYP